MPKFGLHIADVLPPQRTQTATRIHVEIAVPGVCRENEVTVTVRLACQQRQHRSAIDPWGRESSRRIDQHGQYIDPRNQPTRPRPCRNTTRPTDDQRGPNTCVLQVPLCVWPMRAMVARVNKKSFLKQMPFCRFENPPKLTIHPANRC